MNDVREEQLVQLMYDAVETSSGEPLAGWVELALASPVVLWAALPFFRRFWNSLRNRSPNMWTLIGLGVGSAYVFSVVSVVAPEIFPMSMTHMTARRRSISRRRR